MLIHCGFDLEFDVPAPTPMLLALYLHPWRAQDFRRHGRPGEQGLAATAGTPRETLRETLRLTPEVPVSDYTDVFGNRVGRIVAPPGRLAISHRITVEDSGI